MDKICFLCQAEDSTDPEDAQILAVAQNIYLCENCFNNVLTSVEQGGDEFDTYFDLWG